MMTSNDKTTIQPGEALTEASLEAWCEKVLREHPKRCRHGVHIELVHCWACEHGILYYHNAVRV